MSATTKAAINLRERALGYLARREHTALELRRKLLSLVTSSNDDLDSETANENASAEVDALIADFKQRGWVSEERFAEQVAHARKSKFGSMRIAHELREKGVTEAQVEKTLAQVKEDELVNAIAVHRKKYKMAPESREEWAKQARFLQSRGFGFDIIKKVLSNTDTDYDDA